MFSVNQCFGDLNFPSKLYSKSFLIKLDLPPLLDHKKYLVANFVVCKEPTHFCVCVQHILMDSRCCFYLRASCRIRQWSVKGQGGVWRKEKNMLTQKKAFLALICLYLEEISSTYVGCLLSTKVVSTLCMKGYWWVCFMFHYFYSALKGMAVQNLKVLQMIIKKTLSSAWRESKPWL